MAADIYIHCNGMNNIECTACLFACFHLIAGNSASASSSNTQFAAVLVIIKMTKTDHVWNPCLCLSDIMHLTVRTCLFHRRWKSMKIWGGMQCMCLRVRLSSSRPHSCVHIWLYRISGVWGEVNAVTEELLNRLNELSVLWRKIRRKSILHRHHWRSAYRYKWHLITFKHGASYFSSD